MSKSQWCVLTGTFSSGKTTLARMLATLGHQIVPEAARALIDEELGQGKSIQEIRSDEHGFNRRVLAKTRESEMRLVLDQSLFLDRALPDSIAYHRLAGMDSAAVIGACQSGLYRKVFCLEPLGFERDYARTESLEVMIQLHDLLQDAYAQLGYNVIRVPVMAPEQRLEFVLANL